MKRTFLSLVSILLITLGLSFGQTMDKDELKINFLEGESWLLFEEYADALIYYQRLLEANPENDNYNYRIGMCYLNIPGEKHKAITYLEKAVKNINPNYKEGSLKETQAPADAYYYLGHAYRINDQLDKALDAFEKFKEILDPKVYEESIVDEQIQACLNAKKLQQEPLFVEYNNLGEPVNSRFSDFSPIVSGDESVIVFTRSLQFYDALMYSQFIDGEWTEPMNMTEQLGYDVDEKCYSTSISYDGKTVYLYKNDEYDGNIYISRLSDGIWSPVERLNDNINTKYWESHASISKDGKTLYFTSNRKGGYGYLDIYKSERDSTGDWGPAVNLGPNINTPYNEETPFISDNGKILFFSSYGHYNMGGYDIFYSSLLENGEWSKPLNIGYPINTTDDDVFFYPVENGIYGYYAHFSEEGQGLRDIFRYEIFSDEHPRKFHVHGIIPIDKMTGPYGSYRILVLNEKGDTLQILKPDPETGEYHFDVFAGNYRIVFENEGFESFSQDISFAKDQESAELILKAPELVLTDLVANLEVGKTFYHVTSDEPVSINLRLEANSKLAIQSYLKDNLMNEEEFNILEDRFLFTYTPSVGRNLLRFNLTDIHGNTASKEVIIDYTAPIITKPEEIIAAVPEEPVEEVTEEIPEQEIEEVTASMICYARDDPETASEALKRSSSGDLKTILDTLDLEAENIRSVEELIDYLTLQSEYSDYTVEDLIALMDQITENENQKTTGLFNNMKQFASGGLKSALEEVDLQDQGICTVDQLITYLAEKSGEYGYTEEDISDLLLALATNGNPDLDSFIARLREVATGGLARALQELDTERENIYSIEELLAYLKEKASDYDFDPSEISELLQNLASITEIDENAVGRYLAEKQASEEGKGAPGWLFWGVIPAGLIIILIIVYGRRKKTTK